MGIFLKKTKKLFMLLFISAVLLLGLQQPEPAGAATARAFTYQFSDIDSHPWGANYLRQMVRLGILEGYGQNGVYNALPERVITRAEFATLLARTLGLPETVGSLPFADLQSVPDWARGPVKALYEEGIVRGSPSYGGSISFKPNDNVTRAEIVAMIVRALSSEVISTGDNPFRDVRKSDWFYAQVLTANNLGLVNGRTHNAFVPLGTAKRVEVMAILSRFLDKDNGEIPSNEQLISVVKDYYDGVKDILERGGSRDRLEQYVTGEEALGLQSEGAGLLENIPLNSVSVSFYEGSREVAKKSSRLAEVEFAFRVRLRPQDAKAPAVDSNITEKFYLVKEGQNWRIYASDIISVNTEE